MFNKKIKVCLEGLYVHGLYYPFLIMPLRVQKTCKRIKNFRKSKNITQEKLALMVGIDRSYMGSIERGERNITLATMFKIIDALELSPIELFSFLKEK